MRFFFGFFLFFSSLFSFSQTEKSSKNTVSNQVLIETIDTLSEVNTIDNELVSDESLTNNGLDLFSNSTKNEQQNLEIELPIFNLQDDPALAALDLKWMDLIKFYDQFDASSLYVENLPSENTVVTELSTALLKKRLAALDAKSPFNITYNPELERLIKSYIKNRPKAISNMMAKAKYYFPLFEEKLDLYDVPLEVKYLAVIESALQPKAKSRVGATGLWQFMFATGKQYGLDVTSYVDKRQDPIYSSEAAAKHLSDLYDIFEDWDLALAAYNSGAGNVSKAIRRAGGKKNYWNIRPFLPRETANYVPIFYATMYMFEYGDAHNIFPEKQFNLQYYQVDTIQVKRTISFEQIKNTTGIDISLLEFLNPIYKLNIVPYEAGKNYHLILPKEYVGKFVQNEDMIYAYVDAEEAKKEKPIFETNIATGYDSENSIITYRVKSGDYIGKIADKYNVSVKNILKWNRLKSSKVHVGQKIKIYKNGDSYVANNNSSEKSSSNNSTKTSHTYIVKPGDNLLKIANKYPNVSVEDIKKWNKLKSDKINVGAKLIIYKG